MADLARLGYRIDSREVKQAEQRLDRMSRSAQRADASTGGLTDTAKRFAGVLLASGGVLYGLQRVATSAVRTAGRFESLQLRLENMFGSIAEGNKHFQAFKDLAATTPFELQRVVEAGAQLRAFMGDAFQDKFLKNAADLAAFMGTDIVDAANAMGRAFAGGAGAADILRERGILNLIKTSQAIEDFEEITLADFRQAMLDTLADPSTGIPGATDKMSESFEGALSNMEDAITVWKAAVGQKLLPTAERAARHVTRIFESMTPTNLRSIIEGWNTFTDTIENIQDMRGALEDLRSAQENIFTSTGAVVDNWQLSINSLLRLVPLTDEWRQKLRAVADRDNPQEAFQVLGEVVQWLEDRLENVDTTLADLGGTFNVVTGDLEGLSKAARTLASDIDSAEESFTAWHDTLRQEDAVNALAKALEIIGKALKEGRFLIDGYRTGWIELIEVTEQETEEVEEVNQAAEELGFTFQSAFEDAIVRGQGVREILQGIAEDIFRITTRQLITKPFAHEISSQVGGLFQKNAKGAVLTEPTFFPIQGGVGVAGEAGAEGIFPLRRTATGELGVQGSAASVNVQVINNAPVNAEVTEQVNAQGGRDIQVMIGQSLAQDVQQGGPAAQALQEAYGLQRRRRF